MHALFVHAGVWGCMAGVAAAFALGLSWHYGAALCVLGASAMLWYRWGFGESRGAVLCALGILLITAGCGALRGWHALLDVGSAELEARVGTSVTLEGVVIEDPLQSGNNRRFTVATNEGKVLVFGALAPRVFYGDRITVRGTLEKPESFQTESGRTFDYPMFLARKDTFHILRDGEIEILGTGEGNAVNAFFIRAKHLFVGGIERVASEPFSGLAAGVVLGVEDSLSKSDEEIFRKAGLIHIVVVSGYNITLAGDFARELLRAFPPAVSFGGSLIAVVSYILLTGASATSIRAGIMAGLVIVARTLKRRYSVTRALMFAGLLMVVHNPHILLHDPSFQLSFLATWGLIRITPIFDSLMEKFPRALGLREIIASTLGAQTAVTPLLLFQSGSINTLSLIANILVLPTMPLFMFSSIAVGIAALFGRFVALPFALTVDALGVYVFWIAEKTAEVSRTVFGVGAMSFLDLAGVYFVLLMGVSTIPFVLPPRSDEQPSQN